jgi:O-antigen ligase
MLGSRDLLRVVPVMFFATTLPFSVAGGTIGCVLVATAGVVSFAVLGARPPLPRAIVWSLAAFLAVHVIASLLSHPYPIHWHKIYEELWMKLLLVLVPFLLWEHVRLATLAVETMVVAASLVAVYAIYQHFAGMDLWRDEPLVEVGTRFQAMGFYGHHLSYGGSVLLLWTLALAWAAHTGIPRLRPRNWLPWVCVALLTCGLLWSYARSAQLGALAGAASLTVVLPRAKRWIAIGLLAVFLVGAATSEGVVDRFTEIAQSKSQPPEQRDPLQDESTRLNLWQSSLRGIAARPVLGFGLGNFGEMMADYRVEGFYENTAHAHSDYFMHAVNAGLLGLAAALALLATVTGWLWRRRLQAPRRWLLDGAVACQVAIGTAGLFQVYQTDDEVELTLYFLLGCALAVGLADRRPDALLED